MNADPGFVRRPVNDEERAVLHAEQLSTAKHCVESVLRRHRLRRIPVRDKEKRAEVLGEIKRSLEALGIWEPMKEHRAS